MKIVTNDKEFIECDFEREFDFEKEVVINSKRLFGENTIYIDAKRKIKNENLGNSIPDGFLFNLSDKNNIEFYIIEVELAKHNFFGHIFPQITKFISFFKNQRNQVDLIDKIFSFITGDEVLKNEFKKYLGEKEIYKSIKDSIERSQNILLVIDGEKKEITEIMETYSEWRQIVKLISIRKFTSGEESLFVMSPEFQNIETPDIENKVINSEEIEELNEYNEDYHLDGVSENVRQIYNKIKADLLKNNTGLVFVPQKHRIAVQKFKKVAFFNVTRKQIKLIVMQDETQTKRDIKFNRVGSLKENTQKFYGNACCQIFIDSIEHTDEIVNLLNKLG